MVNLSLFKTGQAILDEIERNAPLSRQQAEQVVQELIWQQYSPYQEYGGRICLVPTGRLVERMLPYFRYHHCIVEVAAGDGLLEMTFERAGLLDDLEICYHSTDIEPHHSRVETIGQAAAIEKYHPTLVICSWPPVVYEVERWMLEWDRQGVVEVIAIGPWQPTRKSVVVGNLLKGLPVDWLIKKMPEVSCEIVDYYSNCSQAYLLTKSG